MVPFPWIPFLISCSLFPYSNHVPPDFTCSLEVYSHVLHEDLGIASTPRKIRQTLHSSISRTVGKRLAASLKDELSAENR